MIEKPKAYSYIRMSRPEQLKGDSLRRQLEASRRYAEQNGLELDDQLQDLGLSAYHGDHRERGALGAFLALVEQGKVPRGSLLIVESLDRLSRQTVLDALQQFTSLINAGVEIVTLTDAQRYSRATISADWAKLLVSLTVMARAHEESATKARRLSAAWENKRAKAVAKLQPMTARCPAWICLVDGKYQLIPERAAIVRRIFESTAAGMGQRVLTKALNAEGVPTFGRSSGWQTSYIAKILEAEAAYGRGQPHKKVAGRRVPDGEPIDGYYPAVVDEELWWRARGARQSRYGGGGRKGEGFSNLLSGLCRCAACGSKLVFLNKGSPPKGGQYLQCDSVRRGLGCKSRAWRYDTAERVVLEHLTRLDPARVLHGIAGAAATESRVEMLEQKLEADKALRDKLLAAFEDLDDDAIAKRIRALAEKIKAREKELKAAKAEEKKASATHGLPRRLDMCREIIHRLGDTNGDELYALRSALAQELRRILDRLVFSDRQITAYYAVPAKGPVSRLALPDNYGMPLLGVEEVHGVALEAER